VAKGLTPGQRSAIERAKRNPDLQPILFRKAVGVHWFSAFKGANFLRPEDIPPPKSAKEVGYVNIPAWPITDYLVSTSPELLAPENEEYAEEFLKFIRETTNFAKEHNYGNYRVWWQFSKVICNIPPRLINPDDVALVDYWLDDPYERGLVAESLGEDWLISLLDRDDSHCRAISLSLLTVLYKIKIVEKENGASNMKEAVLRYDSWHAKEITKKLAPRVGRVLELAAVKMFQKRLEEILLELNNDQWSSIRRRAIEDHVQNHPADDAEDIIIEGYRDSLLAFIEKDTRAANDYIGQILLSQFETTRRIAIYAIDRRFQDLRGLLAQIILAQYFTDSFRHELWHLLHNHYLQFSGDEKRQVQDLIAGLLKVNEKGEQIEGATAYRRAVWLSAIKEFGDDLSGFYRRCVDVIGGEPEHPDFSSYVTSGYVDHKSPISKDELLSLDIEELVRRLNSYQDPGGFGEVGLEGLVKALRRIVKEEPLRFYNQLHQFSNLDLPYVYEIIEAYSELWIEKAQLPWEEIWGYLLAFFDDILKQERFWSPENAKQRTNFVANRYWIVSGIGRIIENGSASDDHAFSEKYLEQAKRILLITLEKEEGEEFKPDSDAVAVAINSPRGHCLEALIILTLRACRLENKQHGQHINTWSHFQPIYDIELTRTDTVEYEFVTLVSLYLSNFLYMSREWVLANLEKLFNGENYQKWLCAMQGYAHLNTVDEEIYKHLKEEGHFMRALDDENIREKIRNKFVQNIAAAYLKGYERLEEGTSLIHQLIVRKKYTEIGHLIWFLWTLRKDGGEKIRGKIFEIWPLILASIDTNTQEGRKLASKLCDWTAFVDQINATNKSLILAVAPYADENHHSHDLLRSIARISKRQPLEAYEIWRRMLDGSKPTYPQEAIRTTFTNLLAQGADGVRKAKEITDQYLRCHIDGPSRLLLELLGHREADS
jgi:hypothetical protein